MISIIIINYFQLDLLKKCVESIYHKVSSYPFEVILINNSAEEDISFFENEYSNLKVVVNGNYGFSNGNNLGARNSNGEYLLFLNPDTELKTDPFVRLIPEFEKTKFGAVGLKLYNPDGSFQLSFGNELDFNGEIKNKHEEEKFYEKDMDFILEKEYSYNEVRFVDWVTGAALFMQKSVFEKIKGWDERYFLYYEDTDLCKRLRESGLPVFFFPFTKIIHHKGENTNKNFYSGTYYFAKRSQLLYYSIHLGLMQNIMLRIYLGIKFFVFFITRFNPLYFRIFRLIFLPKSKLQAK